MPSRADRLRTVGEWTLRGVAVGALGLVLWRWLNPATPSPTVPDVVAQEALPNALARWTTSPAGAGHAALDTVPNAVQRDWLRALRNAGMRIAWSARNAPALAVTSTPIADPAGGTRLDVAAPSGLTIAAGGALATTDTLVSRASGGSMLLPSADAGAALVARATGATARVVSTAAPRLGGVLVLGRAGWEAKFVAAALEERGWSVSLRASVALGLSVVQGEATHAVDTSSTAAVVVLDSGLVDAADAARLARYVRDGGGVVLAGDASRDGSLRSLAAGDVGVPVAAVPGALDAGRTSQRGLVLLPIVPRTDAIVLERRDGQPAVAARRIGAGRAAQIGYVETWRWRMSANDGAPAAHRAWWARVIASVAYAPVPNASEETVADASVSHARSSEQFVDNDPAPLAATIAVLGPSSAAPSTARRRPPTGPRPSDGALAALAGAALLVEVGSRRMRGRR